jgi:rubrerythrin
MIWEEFMNILDFTMEMDRSGRDFYRQLAVKARTPEVRRVFGWMAKEEERLMEEYRRMKVEGLDRQADSPRLQMAANPFRHQAGMNAPQDELEAYRLILEMEGKACRLLQDAAIQETDSTTRDVLHRVAAVECGELSEVEGVYDFVRAPNGYLASAEFSNLDEFHNFGRYEDNRPCSHTH